MITPLNIETTDELNLVYTVTNAVLSESADEAEKKWLLDIDEASARTITGFPHGGVTVNIE